MSVNNHDGKSKNNIIGYLQSTKRARYKAADRFNAKAKYAKFAILVNSIILIALSIIQLAYSNMLNQQQQTILSAYVLLATVITLLQSYFSNPENYIIYATDFLRCGNDINRLYFTYKEQDLDNLEEREYKDLVDCYYAILDKYKNHDQLDYDVSIIDANNRHNSSSNKFFKSVGVYFHYRFEVMLPLASTIVIFISLIYMFASYELLDAISYNRSPKQVQQIQQGQPKETPQGSPHASVAPIKKQIQ